MTERMRVFDRWLLAGLVGGHFPPRVAGWARRRVENRPGLRSAYAALRDAEWAAAGFPDVTREQTAAIEAAVFGGLPPAEGARAPAGGQAPAAFAWFAAASAAAVTLVVLASGEGASTARGPSADVLGVTARCVLKQESGELKQLGLMSAGPGLPGGTLECPSEGLIVFGFTNTGEQAVYVTVVGITDDDEMRWYAPFLHASGAQLVGPGSVDQMLTTAAELAGMPVGERVGLRAVFSTTPLDPGTVGRLVGQLQVRGLSPTRLERLPLGEVAQARFELRITPPGRER